MNSNLTSIADSFRRRSKNFACRNSKARIINERDSFQNICNTLRTGVFPKHLLNCLKKYVMHILKESGFSKYLLMKKGEKIKRHTL